MTLEHKEYVKEQFKKIIANGYIYEKEDRLAFRLFVGEVSKKIVKSK